MTSWHLHPPTTASSTDAMVSRAALGRGLAALRIFVGIIFFANGLAKLTGERNIAIGWYRGFLIVRDEARNVLQFEVNERNGTGTLVPFLKDIVNDLILPNWGSFQWVVTFTEVGVGLLLILGFVTRGAALIGLLFQLFLALVYFSSNRWMFEQPHEYIPLFILAIVPAGRYWGVDGLLLRDRPFLRRWPF
ncbi:MAG: DoxX family protein [Chloroflexota bacterium]|nr:DoxX family protein [Chloroflexota bacterium]